MRIHSQLGRLRTALLGSMGVTLAGACSGETAGMQETPTTALRHRPTASVCENVLGDKTDAAPPQGDAGPYSECEGDPECPGELGYCQRVPYGWSAVVGSCQTGCVQDSDCQPGSICNCEPEIGHCVSAECSLDSDCPSGQLCLEHRTPNPCGGDPGVAYACAVPGTECTRHSDCGGNYKECVAGKCVGAAVCGRPFLVAGVARRARVIQRDDWVTSVEPGPRGLSADERSLLAEHWAEIGCMEHASVAAFARFSLELLALGAPAELVAASQSALGDEIAHARLAFGLASAYSERPIGPDTLRLDGALSDSIDFVDTVRQAFLEMCMGETCAAVEARAAALEATDPAVRDVLERIATDELRHAELGYRFVKWALDQSTPAVRRSLVADLQATLSERLGAGRTTSMRKGVPGHGLLSDSELGNVQIAALTEVVFPCSAALLGQPGFLATTTFATKQGSVDSI